MEGRVFIEATFFQLNFCTLVWVPLYSALALREESLSIQRIYLLFTCNLLYGLGGVPSLSFFFLVSQVLWGFWREWPWKFTPDFCSESPCHLANWMFLLCYWYVGMHSSMCGSTHACEGFLGVTTFITEFKLYVGGRTAGFLSGHNTLCICVWTHTHNHSTDKHTCTY